MRCGGTGEDRKNGHDAHIVCGHKCPKKTCKDCMYECAIITFNNFPLEMLEGLVEVAERREITMAHALGEVIERALKILVRDLETGKEELLRRPDNWEGGGEG